MNKLEVDIVKNPIQSKVKAGTKSVAASTPLGIVLMWILTTNGVDVPPEIAIAIGSLITGGIAFLVSYFK